MISQYLKDLSRIRGVEAVAIYSINNTLVDSWAVSSFNSKVLEDVSLNCLQVYSVLDLNVKSYKEIVICHDKGQVYVRMLPDFLLLVVVKTGVEVSLIRLIINVKIPELLSSKQFQKTLKKFVSQSHNFLDKKYLDESEKEYIKKLNI